MAYLEWTIFVLHALAAITASWHALLYKRDSRAAFGWIGVCILFPLAGPLLYYLLGVNRVESRARLLGQSKSGGMSAGKFDGEYGDKKPARRQFIDFERGAGLTAVNAVSAEALEDNIQYAGLIRAGQTVTGQALFAGNHIDVLHNGEGAYPPMLAAIEQAERSVYLMTYIFETNGTGRRFIEVLGQAVSRGVDVRVMIDGVGEKYSLPRATRLLKRLGVEVCRSNPPRLIPPSLSLNLRNHRKILVVDNRIGFTGGINIGDRHLVARPVIRKPVADIHFSVTGPVVAQLATTFADGWQQATRQTLPTMEHQSVRSEPPVTTPTFPGAALTETGGKGSAAGSRCRVIVDGPDENLDRLALVLESAVSSAQRSICIMTPYFLPSRALTGAIQGAALRGVNVKIVLPGKNNLPYVHWATRNMLWELLYYQVEVFYQPPPFAHSKLLLVDGNYALVGSANIDPRSLRLNYELGLEIYDEQTTGALGQHFQDVVAVSRPVTLAEVDGRSLAQRTRDSLCWLFSPYL
jgi:cardiolipin synthase